jgi:tRNA 5-methylaminomethyl-2-thiouridine biosynthesis bifunctional protein
MKTAALDLAEVEFGRAEHQGTPYAPRYGDIYHARAGALEQARHVYLAGNGLPARWQGRRRFVVLETGFGLGNNFLATWAAWRADPERCTQLVFVSIEKHPLSQADLRRALLNHAHTDLAAPLLSQWPVLTPDLHTLEFDNGQVRLLLALGDVALWRSELVAAVDAFYLDGFAPARNAVMWDERLCKALARMAAPGATAATWSIARELRDGLGAAGFTVTRTPSFGSKRDMCCARFPGEGEAARRLPAPVGRAPASNARTALVIGAGLAGAAAARALAREGLQVTVLERQGGPAQETSGNLAGLFHGVLHPNDGAHAQLLRAAALRTQQLLTPVLAQKRVPGELQGLLRGLPQGAEASLAAARQWGLPPEFIQVLDAAAASSRAGWPLPDAQCLYTGAGWVSPAALVREWLASPAVTLRCHMAVARLQAVAGGGWQALDAQQQPIAEADVVVLATAHDTARLLQGHTDVGLWPLQRRRGQVTQVPAAIAASAGLPRPRLPLASGGYLIALPDTLGGGVLCGATSQADDEDAAVRASDHRHNLRQIETLTGSHADWSDKTVATLPGKVGWRLATDDRLPVVGAVPLPMAQMAGLQRLEQPRHVPRAAGLYVMTALGSRGLTWAGLLGEALAACVSGAPVPLSSSVLDAVDPARFVARSLTRSARRP